MQNTQLMKNFDKVRPPGIKSVKRIPGVDEILTKKSGKLYLVKYFLDDGRPPIQKKMISFSFQDKSLKKFHGLELYDLKMRPMMVIKLKPDMPKQALIDFVGDLVSKSKYHIPKQSRGKQIKEDYSDEYFYLLNQTVQMEFAASMIGQIKNIWKHSDPYEKFMYVIYGVLIAIPIILKARNFIMSIYKWFAERHIAGPAEQKLNQQLFQGQTAEDSAFGLFAGIQRYLQHIIDKRANALILCGPPGMSKTYTTRRTFYFKGLRPRIDYVIEKGSTLGLSSTYSLLYENRNRILVLDDFDTPLTNPEIVNLLKAITDTYEKRIVSLPREKTYSQMGTGEEGEVIKAPDKFEFKGQVIIITNLLRSQIDPALLSRAPAFEVNFDAKQVLDSLGQLMKYVNPNIDMKMKQEVYEYILKMFANDPKITVNYRSFKSAVEARAGNPEGWKEMMVVIFNYKGKPIRESLSEKVYLKINDLERKFLGEDDYFYMRNKHNLPNLKKVEVTFYDPEEGEE